LPLLVSLWKLCRTDSDSAVCIKVALYTFDRQTSQWAYFAVVTLV
jgi:hypothetical protein